MDKYGVKSTHEAIKRKLLDYINTVYLGKNDSLREACSKEIDNAGVLFQEPYIEANHAYLVVNNGISKADIPEDVKSILDSYFADNTRAMELQPNGSWQQVLRGKKEAAYRAQEELYKKYRKLEEKKPKGEETRFEVRRK